MSGAAVAVAVADPVADAGAEPAVLDDFDSRPGGSMSLLRTIVGSCLRQVGGWMSTAGAVAMLATLDIPPSTARSTLARLSARGVLDREPRDGIAGYALREAAIPMLERGDARIFAAGVEAAVAADGAAGVADDPADATWCLVSFSIPERHRDRRHQLRRRLDWIGCGTVSDALWIGPERVIDDVRDILAELQLTDEVTVFAGARPSSDRPLAELAARWWDLDRVRALHERFIERYAAGAGVAAAGAGRAGGDAAAFATWIGALDEWRPIPYLDPGLPASALPGGWPGQASAALIASLESQYADAALAYARRLADSGRPARTPSAHR